jgi:hypothetical protein
MISGWLALAAKVEKKDKAASYAKASAAEEYEREILHRIVTLSVVNHCVLYLLQCRAAFKSRRTAILFG